MRVPRTFCFADLTGFTNYTAEHGDDVAATLLSAFRAVARDVASARGVRVAKWLGRTGPASSSSRGGHAESLRRTRGEVVG